MYFGVGAYIHYEWSLLLPASPGREDQAAGCGGTERRGEERRKQEDIGRKEDGGVVRRKRNKESNEYL